MPSTPVTPKDRKRKGKDSEITPTSVASRRDRSRNIDLGGRRGRHWAAQDGQVTWAEIATTAMFAGATATATESLPVADPATPCPSPLKLARPESSLIVDSSAMSNTPSFPALPPPREQSDPISIARLQAPRDQTPPSLQRQRSLSTISNSSTSSNGSIIPPSSPSLPPTRPDFSRNIFNSTPSVPPHQINPNSDPDVKIAYLLGCVSAAGFDSLDEAYAAYLTTRFPPGYCQQAQTKSWVMGGVRDVIVKAGDCELSGLGYKKKIKEDFKIGIYTVAQKLYQQEFTGSQVSRQGQKPFLNVAATDVTDEMLTQDTIGELRGLFMEKMPWFWSLLTSLAPKEDRHNMIVVALNILFRAASQNNTRLQNVIGIYLHANGVKNSVITQLNRMGISASLRSIDRTLEALTVIAKENIVAAGKTIIWQPMHFVYDNIQLNQRVGQERIDSHNTFFCGTSGFWAESTTAIGHGLPLRASLNPTRAKDMTQKDIVPVTAIDEEFNKDLVFRSIKRVLNEHILEPLYQGQNLRHKWKFSIRDRLNLRHLTKNSSLKEFPVQTGDFDESKISENIAWMDWVLQKQTKLTSEQMQDFLLLVYGDLATVQNLRGAIRQRSDEEGINSLECLFPVFGLFHLRMSFVSMIYLNHHGGVTSKEFSHLNAIIEKLGLHGFKDTKMHNFRAVEDLLEQAYASYISAWICELFPPPVGTVLSQKERRNLAASKIHSLGKKKAFEQVIVPLYYALYSVTRKEQRQQESTTRGLLFNQLFDFMRSMALYGELKHDVRAGQVGRISKVLRLILPYFAGSTSHRYSKELVAFQMMEYTADPDTWNYILDNCLIQSKLGGWIEADCKMEHLVRTQKDSYTAHGGSFRWDNMNEYTSLLSTLMYETKLVFANSLREEKIKGKHYNPSMERGILNVTAEIIQDNILDQDSLSSANPNTVELYTKGLGELQLFDMEQVREMLYGSELLDEHMIGVTDDLFDGVDTAPGGLDDPDDMGDSLGLTDEQLMPPPPLPVT